MAIYSEYVPVIQGLFVFFIDIFFEKFEVIFHTYNLIKLPRLYLREKL